MKFVSNNITDPTLNLAMEEYVKNLPSEESYFYFM